MLPSVYYYYYYFILLVMFLQKWTGQDLMPCCKLSDCFHVSIVSVFFLLLYLGQVFFLHPSLRVNEGDAVAVSFSMIRSKENHRLMEVEFASEVREPSGKCFPAVTSKFYIE